MQNKGERTQAAIIEAAYTLFVQQGYHGTSMRQIAQTADLALSGLYNHFENKEAIFKAVIVAYHPFVTVIPQLENLEEGSAGQLLRSAAHLFVRELERQDGLFNLIFIEVIELNGRHMPELVENVLPYVIRFQERLAVGNQERFRAKNPVAFFRSYMGTVFTYYLMNELLAGTAVMQLGSLSVDDLMDIYLYGLLLEDGTS